VRVAIVGSRTWTDAAAIRRYIDKLPATATVVSGGAPGVDTMAENAARARGLRVQVFQANWKRYGRGAGMIRNSEIIANADIVLAFWDGQSRGTKDSIDKALTARHVWRVTVIKASKT
jgi:hypothetical protein